MKQCNKGNVILLGVLVMAGIVIAGLTVSALIGRELRRAREVDDAALAYYAAESGIEKSLYRVRKGGEAPSAIGETFALANQAQGKTKAKNKESELKIDFIAKGDFKTIDLYNLGNFTENPGLGIKSVAFNWQNEAPVVSYQEWDAQEKKLGPFKLLTSGTVLDPAKAYRISVKAETDNAKDFSLKAYSQDGRQMDIPVPVTVDSLGQFRNSEQALKVTLASASPLGEIQPPSEGPGIWKPGYTYRKRIIIDADKISGPSDLINFPILISITDNDFKTQTNSGHVANSSGYDIIFTDPNGAQLDYAIEKYDATTGEIVAWIRTPVLYSATNTTIYTYYGNGSITNSQENAANIWDLNYKAAWHLREDPSVGTRQIIDSTSNNNSGTSYGSMTASSLVEGKIAGALDFDGIDDYVRVNDGRIFDSVPSKFTAEAWVKANARPAKAAVFLRSGYNGTFNLDMQPDGSIAAVIKQTKHNGINYDGKWYGTRSEKPLADGQWHHVVAVFDANETRYIRLYIDGVSQQITYDPNNPSQMISANEVLSSPPTFHPAQLGAMTNWRRTLELFWHGATDEVRVSDVVRSEAWITAGYNNQNSPLTFYSVGNEETK